MKKLFFIASLCVSALQMNAQTFSSVSTFAGNSTPGLVNGPVASAEFKGMYGLCMDPSGNMYVADAGNHSIRQISNGVVTTLAGNGTQGDADGQGAAARFYGCAGICYSNGYLYVSDNGNHKIKRVDMQGNVVTVAGTGFAGYQDGSALSASFNNPVNVAVDNNGGILVADYGNNCIREILNGQVTTYAGVAGSGGDQLGSVATALFSRPTGMVMDAAGTLYVADQVNGKIKKISGGTVSLLAGSGTNASSDGTGASADLYRPTYLSFDLWGNIIFVEWITNKVRRVTPAGVVTTIAGTGTAGYTDGAAGSATFNAPYGVCIDNQGNAYIGDKLNNVIRKISLMDVGIPSYLQENALSLEMSPNPANDQVTIKNPHTLSATQILIYDAAGKLCQSFGVEAQQETVSFSVAELQAGEYFIVAAGRETRAVGKMIRQ